MIEPQKIEDFIVKDGEEVTPIIVLTGTMEEYDRFCMETKRNSATAIPVKQGFQLPLYADLPIALYGNYWLNAAYDSPEYKDRMFKVKLALQEEKLKSLDKGE